MGFLLYTFDCDLLVMANAVRNDGRSWLDLRWENGITPNKIFCLQFSLSYQFVSS